MLSYSFVKLVRIMENYVPPFGLIYGIHMKADCTHQSNMGLVQAPYGLCTDK